MLCQGILYDAQCWTQGDSPAATHHEHHRSVAPPGVAPSPGGSSVVTQ
jgi:hypothetical protein